MDMNAWFNSPLTQVGLTMIENDGRPTTQGGALSGVSQNVGGAMERRSKMEEQKKARDQEKQTLNATMQALQGFDPLLAQAVQSGGLEPREAWNHMLKIQATKNKPVDRKIVKGPDDRNYYADTQELVLPNAPPGLPQAPKVQTLKLDDGSEVAVQWDGASGSWQPINAPMGGRDITPRNKLTESQSKLTLFQSLQNESQPVLLEMEKSFDPSNFPDAFAGGVLGGNFFRTPEGQQYSAARTMWAEGALRIATGAAATPEEMQRTIKAFFAEPGDDPQTIKFKAQMRESYSRAIQRSLGETVEGTLPSPSQFAQQVAPQAGGPSEGGWQDVGGGARIRVKPQ